MAFSLGDAKYVFAVRQALRPDAEAVIAALRKRDIRLEILSGDREPAVRAAARALGIGEWRAGVTPADKIARIEDLKRRGHKVMMVGDGLNDAPSLAAAHVSMSPISAAHLSQATADLVFLGRPLAPVVAADRLRAQGAAPDAAEPLACGRLQCAGGSDCHQWRGDAPDCGGGDVGLLGAGDAQRASRPPRREGECVMEVMVILVPLALGLGLVGLLGFLWSLRSGQYDDLEGAAWRAIADDEPLQRKPAE